MMHEIQENKKWNQHAVTNEMLNDKIDALFDRIAAVDEKVTLLGEHIDSLEKRMDNIELRIGVVEDILRDHTKRLRRLEERA
jgi:chromosome segregation ATPase